MARSHMADQFRYTNRLIEKEISLYAPNWHYIDIFTPMLSDNAFEKRVSTAPMGCT